MVVATKPTKTVAAPAPASGFVGRERTWMRPRVPLALAEWSERFRYVTQGPLVGPSGAAVRWSNETFPLQVGIMAAIEDAHWARVAVMGPPQAGGKTDCAAINPILKGLHHGHRDALYMSANALKAHDQWHKKILPAILGSPELAGLVPIDREDAGTKDRRDFTNGCSLFLAGAESIANLSGSTISLIVCDDVQAMPVTLGSMGHACDVAFTRSAALEESQRTHVLLGTAGTVTDYLWRTMTRSSHFRPFVPCLRCGTYQLLAWERLVFDQSDPVAAFSDTWMRCDKGGCRHRIRDGQLPAMLRRVRWAARDQRVGRRGKITGKLPLTRVAGFWWNALYWPFTDWGAYASEWVASRGDPEREKNFQQNVLVIPWAEPEEDSDALTEAEVAEHRIEGHRWGVVPPEADLVTLTADVHARFLYYIVRAWRRADGTSWLVDAGTQGVHGPKKGERLSEAEETAQIGHAIRAALEDLWAMDQEGWPVVKPDGEIIKTVHAAVALVDGGYRPDAVGQFCLQRNAGQRVSKWQMIRGKSGLAGAKAIWPTKTFKSKYGHRYREVNVDEAKHLLRDLLIIPRGQPGAWHTYCDKSLEAYHRHLASEHFVERRRGGKDVKVWEKRPGAGPNHWLDDEVYQIAAALACGVKLTGPRVTPAPELKQPQPRTGLRTPHGQPFLITERRP